MKVGNLELNFANVSLWPNALRWAIAAALCIILLLLGYMLIGESQLTELSAARAKEISLKKTFEARATQAKNLAAYQQQYGMVIQQLDALLQQLPSQSALPALMESIFVEGNKAGVHFTGFKPSNETVRSVYAEVPVQITVTGNYENLAQFVTDLVAAQSIIHVTGFTIVPGPGHQVEGGPNTLSSNDHLIMNISIIVYRSVNVQAASLTQGPTVTPSLPKR